MQQRLFTTLVFMQKSILKTYFCNKRLEINALHHLGGGRNQEAHGTLICSILISASKEQYCQLHSLSPTISGLTFGAGIESWVMQAPGFIWNLILWSYSLKRVHLVQAFESFFFVLKKIKHFFFSKYFTCIKVE